MNSTLKLRLICSYSKEIYPVMDLESRMPNLMTATLRRQMDTREVLREDPRKRVIVRVEIPVRERREGN